MHFMVYLKKLNLFLKNWLDYLLSQYISHTAPIFVHVLIIDYLQLVTFVFQYCKGFLTNICISFSTE